MNRVTGNYKKEKLNKSNKRQSPKKRHPIRNFFICILLIIFILIGLFYYKVQQNGGGMQGVLCTLLGQSIEDVNSLKRINVLLLGISEDLDSELTDTIILCSYEPQSQSAYMLSIPRDTFVGTSKNNAKANDKINTLYSKKRYKYFTFYSI